MATDTTTRTGQVAPPPWSPDAPNACVCCGRYRPQLTAKGKLVRSREPAWRMAEQTRDPGCLQEQFRALAKFYRVEYQHHGDSRKSGAGYPDVHIWADGRGSAYIELKRMDRGRADGRDNPTEVQIARMASLQRAGHLVYLARPCCLLSGAVDELIAAFAGVPCRYIKGDPDGPVSPEKLLAQVLEQPAAEPAPATVRRPRPPPVLPGAELGEPFTGAVGYVVPMPADGPATAAVRELEAWLRTAGFAAKDVPFPMRIVAGVGAVLVHVRAGLARPGVDERVWREGVPDRPFPEHLVDALRATTVAAQTSEKVTRLMAAAASR